MTHPNDNQSIAACVVDFIKEHELVTAEISCAGGGMLEWKPNAVEQLEALISEEIARRTMNEIENPSSDDSE